MSKKEIIRKIEKIAENDRFTSFDKFVKKHCLCEAKNA
jgi:hypothetical protein